jgi:uncharacterized protein (TIGR03067 family)
MNLLASQMLALGVTIIFLQCGSAWSAPVPKEKDRAGEELKKLEGLWEVETVTLSGRPFPIGDPPNRYVFKGSTMTIVSNLVKDPEPWILTLDPAKDPKRMTQTQGEFNKVAVPKTNGQVNLCVYSLDGNKFTYVIARDPKGKPATEFPKSVTPELREQVVVMVLKRVKQ